MKKKYLTRELKLGIIIIGALFLLYFGLNFLKGINIFSSTYSYYAQYDNIGGLVVSTPVYVKGYKVGQVDEIKYDFSRETSFTVKVSVSKDIKLPKGTKIELYDDGIMGGKAIQLLIPHEAQSTAFYAAEDTIESQVSMGLIDQLSAGLLPQIATLSNQADSLIRSIRSVIENESLTNSLASIEKITADFEVSSSQLKGIMINDFPGILNKADVLISDFSDIGKNIKQVDFNSTFSALDYTIQNFGDVANKINNDNGTLGALLNDRQLYTNLSSLSNSADSLVIDLQNNPKRYVHFSLFGRK
ncbi:MCE family protein [Paludibacter sp. 221]|uniref:MlaD family protein n=1 Tax=Paludibacter sp. 221 TaxID=2302939 RepID=UPI0013D00123|nr:MlaD family protein [Paludibacter sp. 221]NDV46784.1 MCE family protein [Paludibacter sp. 221]